MMLSEEQKRSIQAVADEIEAFRRSAVTKILQAQTRYQAAPQDLYESRHEASRHVQAMVDKVEECIETEHQLIRRVPHDDAHKARHDAATRTFGHLVGAKMWLELCAAGLREKDFDPNEDIEKGIQQETGKAVREIAELLAEASEPLSDL